MLLHQEQNHYNLLRLLDDRFKQTFETEGKLKYLKSFQEKFEFFYNKIEFDYNLNAVTFRRTTLSQTTLIRKVFKAAAEWKSRKLQ